MKRNQLICRTAVLAAVCLLAFAAQPSRTAPAPSLAGQVKPVRQSGTARPTGPEEGQRVFEKRCSNCHNAPQGFSPRISGTVVRHMRVRASLSQHEEEVLLRFFNP
jgi:cytochrome c5